MLQKDVVTEEDSEFELVVKLVERGENIFVTGGAGVGKSYTLSRLKERYKKLQITSTTGISAINIGGQTIHSWAGIGIGNRPIEEVVKKIKKRPVIHKALLRCKMLAIDEISMLDNLTFDYISTVLKIIREDESPFGGIQVLIFGDFFQLPPVRMEEDGKDFCFNSDTWKELNLKTIILEKVRRQSEERLAEALNNVRINKTTANDLKAFYERDFEFNFETPQDVLQVFGVNSQADAYNTKCFNAINKETHCYEAKDELYCYDFTGKCTIKNLNSVNTEEIDAYDLAALKRFNEDCRASQKLELKEGCRVMLLKNLDVKQGLANGTCGTVKHLADDAVEILFDNGEQVVLSPAEFEYIKEGRTKIKRSQYPLRLAYGITVHKSQGMTFDKLVVNFDRIFDYGQAYVALSRTRYLEGLIIKGFNPNKIVANKEVVEFYRNLEDGSK